MWNLPRRCRQSTVSKKQSRHHRWREYSARAHFGSAHRWVFRAAEWLWSGSARFRGNPERRRDIRRGLYTRRLACSSDGHHWHRTLRPPPATMVVVATTAYTNLRDVRSQMLVVLRPGRFPYRPASIYLVRRPVQQRPTEDSDVLASLYDSTITGLLDRQVSARSVTCRRRP